jgi:GT2 family glycosyltransferase
MSIDIIIPVYKGLGQTRACVESVLGAANESAFEIVVVDDACPEADLRGYLDHLAAQGRITLLRNDENLGFVQSVNRGMALHPERDVVLLNSDALVANDWLDRLRRRAHAESDIGTVTPFSNNATICSWPSFCAENDLPEGITLSALDAIFRRANAGQWAPIPTAVGFCMYIRRDCLEKIGLFDAQRFGRGYGEENDFCLRAARLGWRHALGADTFVHHAGGGTFGDEKQARIDNALAVLRRDYPDYEPEVHRFVAADPLAGLRQAVDAELARWRAARATPVDPAVGRPVQLHILHDLGGGSDRWYEDFRGADAERRNLALRPITHDHASAWGYVLRGGADGATPLRVWHLSTPIQATAVAHPEYRAILDTIIAEHGVDAILVSSLIGHALDCLDTGLPTVVVAHDYYPYCPAVNLYFNGVCAACGDDRVAACQSGNGDFNKFADFPVAERLRVRERYLELLRARAIRVAQPSHSVGAHLLRLDPRFAEVEFTTIEHAYPQPLARVGAHARPEGERLRLMVLGQLAANKGLALLRAALPEITRFADVQLVGCGEVGTLFEGQDRVTILPNYRVEDLPEHVTALAPDVGLLLSIWPETFSYTLSELFMLGVPPVACALGAFAERIQDGQTGFLCAPTPEALVAKLREIDARRSDLDRVRDLLGGWSPRAGAAMVADYHHLAPVATRARPVEAEPVSALGAEATRALLLNAIWREIKGLHLRLYLGIQARGALWDSLGQRNEEIKRQGVAITQLAKEKQELDRRLDEESAHNRALEQVAETRAAEIAEIRASTSWRVTAPLRWLGNWRRRGRLLASCMGPALRHPGSFANKAGKLYRVWRAGGVTGVKQALMRLRSAPVLDPDAWTLQRRLFESDVLPRLARGAANLSGAPLISVLVPTYNTPADMLRAMLDSVRAQIYPHWELCVADDASTEPRVAEILLDYASRDSRIKLHLGERNRGVAHATNRALEIAAGRFIVFLDHDDLLEPHALYRVAQTVIADDPDMVYSDEVLVTPDATTVKQYVHRPAFSPEFFRGHPYIVHLIGFRAELLRRIGGLDERLGISQDYDLILRASEAARAIVHIPEVLYQWRVHESSAGHQKMGQVMDTSRAILGRHLERLGLPGRVDEGVGFNLFDARYELVAGLKVAIIIPTKNHVDLLRVCVDSIRATAPRALYDIVIVDHESDDPDTRHYLDGLGPDIRVLPYHGPFNFSRINNWAVAQLPEGYSHYLFCNNDIEAIEAGWLERMLELGQQPDIGVVGALLYYSDRKTIQHAGVCVGAFGRAEHYGKFHRLPDDYLDPGYMGAYVLNHEVAAVTAACLLMRADAFDAVGAYDEAIAVGFGDVDLCLNAWEHGYRVVFCPHAALIHHESRTRGISHTDTHPEDTARYKAKWATWLQAGDPFYNPGLSLESTTWATRQPLRCEAGIVRRICRKSVQDGVTKYRMGFSYDAS